MTRAIRVVAVMVVVLALAAGCRSATGRSFGTIVDDQSTHASLKAKLAADRFANLTWVGVDVQNGVVTLSGNAKSEIQKQRAENIARQQPGVRGVVNNIMVTPEGVAHAQELQPSAQAGTAQQATVQQPGAQATDQAAAAPAASPAAAEVLARQTVTGEVSDVNHGTGVVKFITSEGRLDVVMPQQALRNVREGDRVTIDMVIRSAR